MSKNADEINKAAQALMDEEQWIEAIKLIEAHPNFHENHRELAWNLGWAYFKLDEFSIAEQYLQRSVELAPTVSGTWWALGTVQFKSGLLADAERNLKEALRLKDDAHWRLTLAVVLMKAGKLAEAEEVHLKGIELKPDSAKRWQAYGDYLDDIGRMQDAAVAYRKAELLSDTDSYLQP